MATYTVVFDGEWQGDFESLYVARTWARALAETGRIAYLTMRRGQSLDLVMALPEERAGEARDAWTHEARRLTSRRRAHLRLATPEAVPLAAQEAAAPQLAEAV